MTQATASGAPRLDRRVAALDGIRGVAILLVLAGHVVQNYPALSAQTRLWFAAFANASAGVRLFFVLSGYLITTLLIQEVERTGTISIARFYRRRILRIFPAFYVFLVAMALLAAAGIGAASPSSLATAGTFTWNYGFLWLRPPPAEQWTFGHLWTLALEQQFYLFWPALLWLVGLRRGLYWAIALAAWCPIARVVTYFLVPAWRGYVGMMLHTAIDSIIIGCAVALLLHDRRIRDFVRGHGRSSAGVALAWLFVCSPILSTVIRGFPVAAGFTLDAIAAATLISSVHISDQTRIAAVFRHPLLSALGVISYSLYLWQQFFLGPTKFRSLSEALVGILIATGIASASYFVVEKPALRWGRRPKAAGAPPITTHAGC